MADTPMRARAAAALRLPPLADSSHDPMEPPAWHICHICGLRSRYLVRVFTRHMCRDRVSCYQRWKKAIA
jgi:hypothetical protein